MATPERPLSPFTTVYRWQITMTLSILHRITGVILAFGAFGLAAWLLVLSEDDHGADFDWYMHFAASFPGRLLTVGFIWCLIYHLLNGIRHLFWDAGKGFEIKQFTTSGWVVVVLSFVLAGGLGTVVLFAGGTP